MALIDAVLADNVTQAEARARRLARLLNDEFEALKAQDIDAFEALQPGKAALLADLSMLTGVTDKGVDPDEHPLQDVVWDGFKQQMAVCRDAHHRNEILISRQLDAIRGTIAALQGATGQATVEVYDRLGKLSRARRTRGYNEA